MNSPKKKVRAILLAAIVTFLANYAISSSVTTASIYKDSSVTQNDRSGSGTNTTTPRPARSGSGTNTTTPRPSF